MEKILVIDDDSMQLRSIKRILEYNYQVEIAISGEVGIRRIKDTKPDLILLDYEMPKMDGPETFKKIRETIKENIPIVFMTSVADRDRIIDALLLRPSGYVLKPVLTHKLFQTIDDVLHG